MSKTKGNVLDPIEIVKQYGTDAVRFTLASMASPGTDIAFNVARTEGYRAFANKIWNAARFLFMNVDRAAEIGIFFEPNELGDMPTAGQNAPLEARWIVAELNATAATVNKELENYRYDNAANAIYQFFWGGFCDWYLEIVKLRLDFSETADKQATKAALTTLVQVFEASLRMLSPFMPFLTEEIWHALYDGNPPAKSIALTAYPKADKNSESMLASLSICKSMQAVQLAIIGIRTRRKEIGAEEKAFLNVKIASTEAYPDILRANKQIIKKLARVNELDIVSFTDRNGGGRYEHLAWQAYQYLDVFVEYEKQIDVAAETERLTRDIAKYEKGVAAAARQLTNEAFLAKAPAQVVEGLKKQEAETRLLLDKAQAALAALPKA